MQFSCKYRRRRNAQEMKEFRDNQRKRAEARWARVRERRRGETTRATRVVEVTIRDSHRPRIVLRLEAQETGQGWGRWRVSENGTEWAGRKIGTGRVARAVARVLI